MTTTVQLLSEKELMDKLQNLESNMKPDSVAAKVAFTKIGDLLRAQMIVNIKGAKPPIHDTGRLINSIKYRFLKNGVKVGSMGAAEGVPYARLMEFGGVYSEKMRSAMFARLREERKLGTNKGVLINRKLKERPYVSTALDRQRERIAEILADEILRGLE